VLPVKVASVACMTRNEREQLHCLHLQPQYVISKLLRFHALSSASLFYRVMRDTLLRASPILGATETSLLLEMLGCPAPLGGVCLVLHGTLFQQIKETCARQPGPVISRFTVLTRVRIHMAQYQRHGSCFCSISADAGRSSTQFRLSQHYHNGPSRASGAVA